MNIVVHLLERDEHQPADISACDRLCNVYDSQLSRTDTSSGYRILIRNMLRQKCVPIDRYLSCFYSTVRFSIESNFK